MSILKDLFSESSNVSAMRVMAFISLFIGGVIAIIGIFRGVNCSDLSFLSSAFIVPAFTGKAYQKHLEVRQPQETNHSYQNQEHKELL